MGIFPRNDTLFELLSQLAASTARGAALYVELFDDLSRSEEYAERIRAVERECDRHSAAVLDWLNDSFITPLDREDIYEVASEMDDVMDMVYKISRLTVLYDVKQGTPAGARMARLLHEATQEMEQAIHSLRGRNDLRAHVERIRALEDEGDQVSKEAIRGLFSEGADPVELIKWLRIYEHQERGLNRCKHLTKVLAQIVVKNA